VYDYLEFSASRNENPDRPFAWKFMVRMPPELHRRATGEARRQGRAVDSYVVEHLKTGTLTVRR